MFCWLSVLLFCRHIDLQIPVGYIGLERQQDFGHCPHSCIGDGWASRLRRKLDKYMIEATETGHTPQKSPRSTTYTAEPHRGSNARKMGNKLILGSSGDRRRWTKDGRGTGDTTHSRSMVFLLSIGSIFKSGPERIRQPFPRGKGRHRKRLFPAETPPGPEVGISQRALTLLPDEKELNSQPPVVVPLTGEALLRMFLPSKHYGIKMTDFVRFILILYSSIFGKHAPQSTRYDSLSISRLDTQIFTAVP